MSLESLLDMAIRRKWYIIILFVVCLMAGIWLYVTLPKIYKAETMILVQPQKVPEAYVQSTVSTGVEDRLRTLSQEIMSWTRLEQIIKEMNLYPEIRKNSPMEIVIEEMRENTELNVQGGDRQSQTAAITLSYMHSDPRTAMNVTNRLASLFIEENLKLRTQQARGTSEFLGRELEKIRGRLQTQEQALKEYKQRYMGELPEQLPANLNELNRLQLAIQTTGESIAAAEQRKLMLQQQLSDHITIVGDRVVATNPLQNLITQLADYQSRYTENHPDVIKTKRDIAALRKELQAQNLEAAGSSDRGSPVGISQGATDPRNQLNTVSVEIARLNAERKRLEQAVKRYQKRVENTPKREQELMTLTRDYNITQENYQSLLDKKIEAEMAENLEQRQQGEQFKVLDPARFPERPFKPDVRKILMLSLMLGLGSGIGLAFLLEYTDKSFRDQDDVESFLEIPVLASIPLTHTERALRLARRKKVAYAIIATIIMAGYIAALYYIKSNGITIGLPI